MSAGGILASNKVNSLAEVYIDTEDGSTQVDAGGAISLTAEDRAEIQSDSKVVQSAITTNTLDALKEIAAKLNSQDYKYTTASGEKILFTGDRVRLGENYAGNGDGGSVYRYVGTSGETLDLSTQNYDDTSIWEKITGGATEAEEFFPNIGNLTDSDARAIGGLIVMNDLRSEVNSFIDDATVTAESGDISLSATDNATLQATSESNVTALGGSAYGTGTVLAVNFQIATNRILSSSHAYLSESTVTATAGNISLDSRNTSQFDATIHTATTSGDQAIGVVLAFNTIGWGSQNILFNTIDALIGSPEVSEAFGNEQPAEAIAYIKNSTINSGGDLTLSGVTETQLNATVSNAAESTASALYGANGMSAGGILSSNMVSSVARAYIDNSEAPQADVNVGGGVNLTAEDNAGIYANSKVVSSSMTTNDGGAAVLSETLTDFIKADYLSDEGSREIRFGEKVRLTDDYANGECRQRVYLHGRRCRG